MLTTSQVRRVVRATVRDIASRYPELPAPDIEFNPPPVVENAAYNFDLNAIGLKPERWTVPGITEQDLRAVIAHEMGHWHQWHAHPVEAREGLFFQQLAYIGLPVANDYREMPSEVYADQFAADYMPMPIDMRDIVNRFESAHLQFRKVA